MSVETSSLRTWRKTSRCECSSQPAVGVKGLKPGWKSYTVVAIQP